MAMPPLERQLLLSFNIPFVCKVVGQLAPQGLLIDLSLGSTNLDQRLKNNLAIENPGKRIDLV